MRGSSVCFFLLGLLESSPILPPPRLNIHLSWPKSCSDQRNCMEETLCYLCWACSIVTWFSPFVSVCGCFVSQSPAACCNGFPRPWQPGSRCWEETLFRGSAFVLQWIIYIRHRLLGFWMALVSTLSESAFQTTETASYNTLGAECELPACQCSTEHWSPLLMQTSADGVSTGYVHRLTVFIKNEHLL